MIKKQKCSSNSRLLSFNNFFSHPESIFRQMILKSPFLSYTLRYRITLLHFLPIWSFLDLYGIPLPNSDNFPTYTLIELHFLLFYVFSMLFTAFFCYNCFNYDVFHVFRLHTYVAPKAVLSLRKHLT